MVLDYPVRLFQLEDYYNQEMLPHNLMIQVFDFTYNQINCNVLLDMSRKESNSLDLYLLKRQTREDLSIPLDDKDDKFVVYARDPERYEEIKKFFNINDGEGERFNLINFFKNMDRKLQAIDMPNYDRQTRAAFYRVDDRDAIYYDTMILWNNHLDKNGHPLRNVTARNRAKVQALLPNLYDRIKNENISVRFTAHPKDERAEQKSMNNDLNDIR